MTNRQSVWGLLLERQGQWVTREDINFVGGTAADRRMREVSADAARSGQYRLDTKREGNKVVAYKVTKIEVVAATSVRREWVCIKCEAHPTDMERTQPAIDPRWRIGPCRTCNNKAATFRRLVPITRAEVVVL